MNLVKVIKDSQGRPLELWYSIDCSNYGDFSKQLASLEKEEGAILNKYKFKRQDVVAKRFFCSDIVNHYPILKKQHDKSKEDFAFFCVGQEPANGSKISMHGLCIKGILKKERHSNCFKFQTSDGLVHILNEHIHAEKDETTKKQTQSILVNLQKSLRNNKLKLSENTLRTWIYQPNLDADYLDMAKQRKLFFEKNLLTESTHYIASTGIQGKSYISCARVFMDSYLISGIQKSQINYISVPKYMPPTHRYGITFERATELTLKDRKLLLISGTASIDRNGKVMYINNISKQTLRIITNINSLLSAAKLRLNNLVNLSVYLRDITDYTIVKKILDTKFKNIPIVYTKAAVCRPSWLVEIEGIAIDYKRKK